MSWEQEKAHNASLFGLSCKLSGELAINGGDWEANAKYCGEGNCYAEVVDKSTGARIGLTQRDGKLHLSGQFQERVNDHQVYYFDYRERPSIGVSITRTPQAIAAEIRRRLLPAYLPMWQKNLEAIAEYQKHAGDTLTAAAWVADRIGAPKPELDRDGWRCKVDVYHSKRLKNSNVDVTVNEGRVTFGNIEVGLAMAEEILAILVRHHKPSKD